MLSKLRGNKKPSMFRSLFTSHALLLLALILIIVVVYTQIFQNAMLEQSIQDSKEYSMQLSANSETNFLQVRNGAYQIASMVATKILCSVYQNMDWAQRLLRTREIDHALNYLSTSIPYVYSVLVIGQDGFYLAKTNSSAYPYQKIAQLPYINPYIFQRKESILYVSLHEYELDFTAPDHDGGRSGKLVISVVLPVSRSLTTVGCVMVDLDYERLRERFSMPASSERDIYMIDSEGRYLFASSSALDGTQADQELVARFTEESGSFIIHGEQSRLIHFRRDNITGWYCVVETQFTHLLRHLTYVKLWLFIIACIVVLLELALYYVIQRRVKRPMKKLSVRMDELYGNNLLPAHDEDYQYAEINRLAHHFELMVERINDAINNEYLAEMHRKQAEIKALQAQITPHFLHNALQTIQSEVMLKHTEEASNIVAALGRLLRYSMDQSQQDVLLREEIAYIRGYLEIFTKRFAKTIQFSLPSEDEIPDIEVPRMILQPIIENSIQHGKQMQGRTLTIYIQISFAAQNEALLITIFDNGTGINETRLTQLQEEIDHPAAGSADNIGLVNTHTRLQLKYGKNYGLNIKSSEGAYTKVEICLPYRKNEDSND